MNPPPHILVVDDDPDLREMLGAWLTQEGYRVSAAPDGLGLRRQMAMEAVDLVLLDLVLPGEDGLSLTRFLREHTHTSIIILTGKGDILDRIIGLEVGADDYVTKPFDLRELLARIKSVLRRTGRRPARAGPDGAIEFAGWRLDMVCRQLLSPQGREVPLTTGEFDLLSVFVRYPNRVLSRDELLQILRHRPASPDDRSIDVQIGRLRRKIESRPDHPVLVKTVRGAGYIFTPPVARQ